MKDVGNKDEEEEEAFIFFSQERDGGGKLAKTSSCDCSLPQPNFRVGISQCKKISMQASKTDGRFFGGQLWEDYKPFSLPSL